MSEMAEATEVEALAGLLSGAAPEFVHLAIPTHIEQAKRLLASDWYREQIAAARAEAWDERSETRPQYLGPNNGHYDDCMGWEDCWCASYPNPYRAALVAPSRVPSEES